MARVRRIVPPYDPTINRQISSIRMVRPGDKTWTDRTYDDTGHFDLKMDFENLTMTLTHTPFQYGTFGETITIHEEVFPNSDRMHEFMDRRFYSGFSMWDVRNIAGAYIDTLRKEQEVRDAYIRRDFPANNSEPLRKMRNGKRYLIYTWMHEMKCDNIRFNHIHAIQIWIKSVDKDEIVYNETISCGNIETAQERYQYILDNFNLIIVESML